MSALERVIAEQQAHIDHMKSVIARQQQDLNKVFTRHDDLFYAIAVWLDADTPDKTDEGKWREYRKLRQEVRTHMLETGYCLRCYSFTCECENQYD